MWPAVVVFVDAARRRIAAENGISNADRDLFLAGTDDIDRMRKIAERLGPTRLPAARVPGEGRDVRPPAASFDAQLAEFAADMFHRPHFN